MVLSTSWCARYRTELDGIYASCWVHYVLHRAYAEWLERAEARAVHSGIFPCAPKVRPEGVLLETASWAAWSRCAMAGVVPMGMAALLLQLTI